MFAAAMEPHSALPSAFPAILNKYSGLMPKGLQDIKALATSVVNLLVSSTQIAISTMLLRQLSKIVCCHETPQVFYLPATKHLWWWLGIRSIDKANFHKLLEQGESVVLVPGGVSECMIMEKGMSSWCLCQATHIHLLSSCESFRRWCMCTAFSSH